VIKKTLATLAQIIVYKNFEHSRIVHLLRLTDEDPFFEGMVENSFSTLYPILPPDSLITIFYPSLEETFEVYIQQFSTTSTDVSKWPKMKSFFLFFCFLSFFLSFFFFLLFSFSQKIY